MIRVRTALYLDFDNVFSGLFKVDPEAAIEFAESPGTWLSALADSLTVNGPRRWLVLRCYMNPAGWVLHPNEAGERLYFSKFRPAFTQAGFEVIDCPRLSYTKNAADIRLVLDAVDAMSVVPPYEEFVVASGDSDMTPLLVRLRAADRRTTIFSPSDAAEAVAIEAFRQIGTALGLGLAGLAAVLDVDVFVVGGGVAAAGELLRAPAELALRERLVGGAHRPRPDVRLAALGNEAGIVGAADLARVETNSPVVPV